MRVANSDAWDDTPKVKEAAEIYHQGLSKLENVDIVTQVKVMYLYGLIQKWVVLYHSLKNLVQRLHKEC